VQATPLLMMLRDMIARRKANQSKAAVGAKAVSHSSAAAGLAVTFLLCWLDHVQQVVGKA
jgi:hypothetical protein